MIRGFILIAVIYELGVVPASAGPTVSQVGQVLVSFQAPRIRLQIDSAFRPLRPLSFPLTSTVVDRRIYVKADSHKDVRGLIVIQFESVKPGSTFKFVYRPRPPAKFGDNTYRFGAYIYDDAKEASEAPTMESARTRAFLTRQGYRLPRLFRTVRLARVTDEKGQSEVIVFYIENADADYAGGVLPNTDADGDLVLDAKDAAALFSRLKSAIHASRGY
jgi:hypothetical protein